VVMGVITGLAVGVKYTAGSIAVALIVFVLIREPRRFIQNAAIFGAAAALVFGLWAVKGIALYGNPIYPFVFNGVNWDAGRSASFSYTDRGFLATGDAWQIPILPISATVLGQDNVDTYGFTAGAWLLTSFLLLPLVWRDLDSRTRALAKDGLTILLPLIAVWMVLAAWSITGTQTRLMLGALPAFAVTGALGFAGLANFPKKPLDVNWMVRAALTITVALGLFDVVNTFVKDKPAPYLLGQITLDDYMYTNTGAYYGALQNLATLPEGSQVRLMWEPRSYYCPPTITCSGDVLFDHWSMPLRNGATVDEVFAGYRAAGDDYLLLFMTGYETYLSVTQHDEYDQQFAAAIEQSMTPVWTDGLRYTLYGWSTADTPKRVR
ncbi:MAG: hypothetical protein IAE80_28705, partial [Anaerolinea sp.]|nr:hypothetical protein [Anaerolinea sp.]